MEEKCMPSLVSVCILRSFRRKPMFWGKFHSYEKYGFVLCGSKAEFYMKPIHNCIDDIDVLCERPGTVAFDDDVPLLPDYVRNLHEDISCLWIEPYSSYPAFVQLRLAGRIKYNWSRKKYEFFQAPMLFPATIRHELLNNIANWENHMTAQLMGPAIRYIVNGENVFHDLVNCIRCPQWPKEVSNWPIRPRRHSWPTKYIILEVVRRGCHIVNIQHRDCGDDEYQWRLSFSVAEVLLLRSWTPTQQIVYHMLRFFAKRELIQKDCPKEKEVLCTYHFKTLMLWACEQESPEWWDDVFQITICREEQSPKWWHCISLIKLCCALLRKLSEWLQKRCCPNYFIPEANLFYENTDLQSQKAISERVNYFCDTSHLSQWFITNYILPHYNKVTGSAKTTLSASELIQIALEFHAERASSELESFDKDFCAIHYEYIKSISQLSSDMIVSSEIIQYSNTRIRSTDVASQLYALQRKELIYFQAALLLLAAPNAISCGKATCSSNFIFDVLRLTSLVFVPDWWLYYHNFPEKYEPCFEKSFVYFLRAQECLGNLYARLSPTEFKLRCRMSMEFLRKSIMCKDSSSDAVRCAVVVYAAAICYANSQYHTAYDMCSTALSDQCPAPTSDMLTVNTEPLNAGCLLFMDEVAEIVGFLVICIHVLDYILKSHRQFVLDLRISPNFFAQYILLQSNAKMSKRMQINGSAFQTVFQFDTLLLTKVRSKLSAVRCIMNKDLCSRMNCVYRRKILSEFLVLSVTGFSMTEDICVQLFIECSLEKMACFYQAVFEKFGLQGNTIINCYRALYLYKSRKYDEAMNLCEEILHEADLEVDLKNVPGFLYVIAYPPFLAYFDEDMQCIVGLQLLYHFICRLSGKSERFEVETIACLLELDEKVRSQAVVFARMLRIDTFRCQYFLRKHFIARYLKLRRQTDCKSSLSEIRRAFDELQPRLPLEHIICKFLLRKLQEIL